MGNNKWVASHFLTVAGKKNEGCVAFTSPVRATRFEHLAPKDGIWFLYQSNDDWAKPSVDMRRAYGVGGLDSIGQAAISEEGIVAVLQQAPLCSAITDFDWVATPAKNTRRFIHGYE